MTEPLALLPAGPLHGLLAGFDALGLDGARLRAAAQGAIGGVPLPAAIDALVPTNCFVAAWDEAERQHPQPGLATRVAARIPFGAFGVLDYLCGSAATVGGSFESMVLHYRLVSTDTRLEIEPLDDGFLVRVRPLAECPPHVTEFVLGVLVDRLRRLTAGAFRPRCVLLLNPVPDEPGVHARLFGAPTRYAQPLAALDIGADAWTMPIEQADPILHRTLHELAGALQVRSAGEPPLESALRARLREALPAGQAEVADLARLLGVSERTLQRRLAELGKNFAAIVEEFRRDEAARLLADKRRPLVDVAAALGYREQTSFTRAFRRWTGATPAAWRAQRA